jgi:transcriptional repressor NrdR
MRCPKCGYTKDKVIDTRIAKNGEAIRRRRQCLKCHQRFTTYEEIINNNLRVIKQDGRHEEFDRSKLLRGIMSACQKRAVSRRQIEDIVDLVVADLENHFTSEVPSSIIGEKVMQQLQTLDEVAYVRFASVYRRFKDVNEFLTEVKGLIKNI